MDAARFQEDLHYLAVALGQKQQRLFDDSFGADWRDEESTTGNLFGALVMSCREASDALVAQGRSGIRLTATFMKKREEAQNGVDVLVRFRCSEPEWQINTTTLIQAKKLNWGAVMGVANHQRLTTQLNKMLSFTSESFVLIYSEDCGIHVVPAVAALALGSRSLFDIATIRWDCFLSAVFRGRMGEPTGARVHSDVVEPIWELDVVASANREEPLAAGRLAGA